MSKLRTKQPGRVRSALLDWLGVPVSLKTSGFWEAWSASSNKAGQTVSESTVLSLSAAWACTRLLGETGSTLPFLVYERTPDGRRPAPEHPVQRIINVSPNTRSSANTFWEALIVAVALRGNGFGEKRRLNGRLVSIDFLVPWRLGARKRPDGTIQWLYTERDGNQRLLRDN